MADIIKCLCNKLVRRHPHVFGDQIITSSHEQIENWENIKRTENSDSRKSALSGIPPHLPAILKAHKISEKAARVGFDWETHDQVFLKIQEEVGELEEALSTGVHNRIEEELGDIMFAVVNLGRFLSIDTEDALQQAIARFTQRFSYIEKSLEKLGKTPQQATLGEMETLWNDAKKFEKAPES
jgi:tetrapyrrole methylase family protein/MazG family protein